MKNFKQSKTEESSIYRVVQIFRNDFAPEENRITEEVIWQGDDVDELSRLHPPSKVWGADSLGRSEAEDGYLRWKYRFEIQQNDGSWEKCKDPRHRVVTPELLEIESEAYAYNRRMFPGDYYNEEEVYDEHTYDNSREVDDLDYYDDWCDCWRCGEDISTWKDLLLQQRNKSQTAREVISNSTMRFVRSVKKVLTQVSNLRKILIMLVE